MSDDDKSAVQTKLPVEQSSAGPSSDRTKIMTRAREFLQSPQVQNHNLPAKRKFLLDKGLNPVEMDQLLSELPPQLPLLPPRTYPRPPPSNLPNLLLALARVFSWIAGGSALLMFFYHRFLLPRVIRTHTARHSLKIHHFQLLRDLTSSLSSFRESQAESFAALPRPDRWKEPAHLASCNTLDALLKECTKREEGVADISLSSILRCSIRDTSKDKAEDYKGPSTEEMFTLLEDRLPELTRRDCWQQQVWETLSLNPCFVAISDEDTSTSPAGSPQSTHWRYSVPAPPPPPPLLESLETLADSNLKSAAKRPSLGQHTLESLTGLTGYISANVYPPFRSATAQNAAVEELKKEIRALKGLVLNRRTFMAGPPRIFGSQVTS